MSDVKDSAIKFNFGPWGEWLPADNDLLSRRLAEEAKKLERLAEGKDLHPVIQDFANLIRTDAIVRMYMTQMIDQIPQSFRRHHPKNVDDLLLRLNAVLTVAPDYNNTALVGTPFSAILIWTMGTPAGFAAYRNEKINEMFRRLLSVWSDFLSSPQSVYVLNDSPNGWMCPAAEAQLNMSDYQYDPTAPHWGFTSWNDFFTRSLAPGARPISHPEDDKVVVSACDSTVYKVAHNVKAQSKFWLKSQPYSLIDMLDDNYVDEFIGGTVYQAFLSPFNYHRWHSPVAGTVKKAFVKEGLYFSQDTAEGQDPTDQDHSEGYLTETQTRAIIFIEADDPAIGLICVMPIGMVEISSCIIHQKIIEEPFYHVDKGEELGYFQFGGSTHCVIFRPNTVKIVPRVNDFVKMGEMIALAK